MWTDFLREVFEEHRQADAVVWKGKTYSYADLLASLKAWKAWLENSGLLAGSVVTLEADFSPNTIGLFLCLIENNCIIAPLTEATRVNVDEFRTTAESEATIAVDANDQATMNRTGKTVCHELLLRLKEKQHPGLILFSSGSTGKRKAVLHDLARFLEKFKEKRKAKRLLTFLLFDHIGGIDILFTILSSGGCAVILQDRNVELVLETMEKYKVEVLPASPTFLNLLFLSESYKRYSLNSLEIVAYGTEVMPESTLKKFQAAFPHVVLKQTYGLSELGTLRSKSKASDSLWVKVGGEGYETRIVDGKLEVKAASAMMGYLNAPSPFTSDGYFQTGDMVEVDGEYVRFLGRDSEIINVGGEKVYPAEVENVIRQMDGVADATVVGEKNPITGETVKAVVKLNTDETVAEFRKRLHLFCARLLADYKIPRSIRLTSEDLHSDRFKKIRSRSQV